MQFDDKPMKRKQRLSSESRCFLLLLLPGGQTGLQEKKPQE